VGGGGCVAINRLDARRAEFENSARELIAWMPVGQNSRILHGNKGLLARELVPRVELSPGINH